MRKAFNFYNSYFEVYKELKTPKEKVAFIDALLYRQFHGEEPNDLKGSVKLAYVSQKHSIDAQVSGYETKTNTKLPPSVGATQGGCDTPSVQEKGKGKEKEEEQYVYRKFKHLSISLEEVGKLKSDGYTKSQVDDILDKIENYKGNRKYSSLYLTSKAWLRREFSGKNSHDVTAGFTI